MTSAPDSATGPTSAPTAAPTAAPGAELTAALAAELAKRTGVSWVRHQGRAHPVWHAWADDALCLVSGGDEQPLPDLLELPDGAEVEVVMRSADTGGRQLTWTGRADVVRPGDEAWEPTVTALVAGRLNLTDRGAAPERWAATSVVRRITPTPPR